MVNSCVHQMSGATGTTKCWSVEVEQLLEGLCVISIRRSVKDFTRDWCERLQTHSLDFCVLWQLTINKIILILIFTFFYVLTLNQTLVESILHVYLKKNAWFINRFYIGGQHFGQKKQKQNYNSFSQWLSCISQIRNEILKTNCSSFFWTSWNCFGTFKQSIMYICLCFPTLPVANVMLLKIYYSSLCNSLTSKHLVISSSYKSLNAKWLI